MEGFVLVYHKKRYGKYWCVLDGQQLSYYERLDLQRQQAARIVVWIYICLLNEYIPLSSKSWCHSSFVWWYDTIRDLSRWKMRISRGWFTRHDRMYCALSHQAGRGMNTLILKKLLTKQPVSVSPNGPLICIVWFLDVLVLIWYSIYVMHSLLCY